MFYSHSFLSRKGPLSAIWVAAYFFKKLKKSQVAQTDISASVDKILQDEFDVVTYRVLAYLLLGVVRIFSKKVEYLFNDCNKVVLKIKDFVVSNKDKALVETLHAPYFSITVPERFELDAFDLEILEDTIGGNMLPHEDITLKDSMSNSGAMLLYALDKNHCEEPATCQDFHFAAFNQSEDALSPLQIDFNMEVGTSHNLSHSAVSVEKLRGNRSPLHEPMDLEMFSSVEAEHLSSVKSCTEKHNSNEEYTRVLEVEDLDEIHVESSMQEVWGNSICEETLLNFEILGEVEKEAENPSKLLYELHQTNRGDTEVVDKAQSENENYQIVEDNNLINVQASVGKFHDSIVSHEECGNMKTPNMIEESPGHNKPFSEEHPSNTGNQKLLETGEHAENTRSFGEEHETAVEDKAEELPLSVTLYATPKSKTPDAPRVTAPEFLAIPTPAAKEGPWVPRKRKCLFDDMIVFPNNVIKQYIEDSSDLVCKRRKAPHTALAAWRAYQFSSLPRCFWEPLLPYSSSELRSLFCRKKLKIPSSLDTAKLRQNFVSEYHTPRSTEENVETLQKLDESKACNNSRSVEIMNSLENLNVSASPTVGGFVETVELPEKVDVSESPAAGSSVEQTIIAPETPVQRTKSLRSFESPVKAGISDLDSPRLDSERLGSEPSPSKQQNLDISFMNEDINSCQVDKQDQNGLSDRTRVVLRYLNRSFLNQKDKREDEVVNLMPLLEGRTRKESARLFYEILMLRSKGYVNVRQENSYGDILIWKTSQWEQACGGSLMESPCRS